VKASEATGKQVVSNSQLGLLNPVSYRVSCLGRDLKLPRPASLLLYDACTLCYFTGVNDIAYPKAYEVARPQLAVDAQVEQG